MSTTGSAIISSSESVGDRLATRCRICGGGGGGGYPASVASSASRSSSGPSSMSISLRRSESAVPS